MIDKRKTLFVAFWIALWLAACGAPHKVWTYRDMVVGFVQTPSVSAWRDANTASFQETAKELGIQLKYSEPSGEMKSQEESFMGFVADAEVNVIVLAALETIEWDDELREAKDAGKVVILEDRRTDAPEDLYATFVGSDFVEEGRKAGVEMCRLLEGSGKKIVWELSGAVGSAAAVDRGRGFRETMGDCGIELVYDRVGSWSGKDGKAATEAFLAISRDVQGIFAQNDALALGAIEALKEAGLKPGVDVKIVSIDGTSGAFDAMLAGELNAAVECNPRMAPQVYAAALRALNGEILPEWIPTEETVFRSDMPDLPEIAASRKY